MKNLHMNRPQNLLHFQNKLRIKSFEKIIDLPYKEKNTLLIKHCIENEIDYVDGKMFWKWQAKSQLKKFLNEIKNI